MEASTFTCSICGETSRKICVYCTKDTCANHLCERCHRCSDCCLCETPLLFQEASNGVVEAPSNGHVTVTEMKAEPVHLPSDDAPVEVIEEPTAHRPVSELPDDPPPADS